jgi:hypothetical protein
VELEQAWVSLRLGIRIDLNQPELAIYRPDGQPFLTFMELTQQSVELEKQAEQAMQRAEQESQRAERLAERLRALGDNPDLL